MGKGYQLETVTVNGVTYQCKVNRWDCGDPISVYLLDSEGNQLAYSCEYMKVEVQVALMLPDLKRKGKI